MLAFLFIYPGEVPEMAYPSQMCACLHGGLFICLFVGMLVSVCLSSFWSMHRFIRIFFLCVFGCTTLLLDPQWHVTHEPKHTTPHTEYKQVRTKVSQWHFQIYWQTSMEVHTLVWELRLIFTFFPPQKYFLWEYPQAKYKLLPYWERILKSRKLSLLWEWPPLSVILWALS